MSHSRGIPSSVASLVRNTLLVLALATGLAACGGGSDSTSSNTQGSSSSPTSQSVTGVSLPSSVSVVTANNAN